MAAANDSSLPPATYALKADWKSLADVPARVVNQFVATVGLPAKNGTPDGIYVGIGHAAPPTLLGGPDEIRAELETFGGRLDVEAYGRFILTRARLEELIEILKLGLRNYDDAVERYQRTDDDEEARA